MLLLLQQLEVCSEVFLSLQQVEDCLARLLRTPILFFRMLIVPLWTLHNENRGDFLAVQNLLKPNRLLNCCLDPFCLIQATRRCLDLIQNKLAIKSSRINWRHLFYHLVDHHHSLEVTMLILRGICSVILRLKIQLHLMFNQKCKSQKIKGFSDRLQKTNLVAAFLATNKLKLQNSQVNKINQVPFSAAVLKTLSSPIKLKLHLF